MKPLLFNELAIWQHNANANETLLFLHSEMTNHTIFDEQVAYFKNDYNIITLDIFGHGQSLNHKKFVQTPQIINDYLAENKYNKIHAVGIGIGSLIGQLCNVDSLFSIGGHNVAVKSGGVQRFIHDYYTRALMNRFGKEPKKLASILVNNVDQVDKVTDILSQFKTGDFRVLTQIPRLNSKKSFNKPLFIGIGELEIEGMIEVNELWHKETPQSEFMIFPQSKQLVNLEDSTHFNEVLRTFISSV